MTLLIGHSRRSTLCIAEALLTIDIEPDFDSCSESFHGSLLNNAFQLTIQVVSVKVIQCQSASYPPLGIRQICI